MSTKKTYQPGESVEFYTRLTRAGIRVNRSTASLTQALNSRGVTVTSLSRPVPDKTRSQR